MADQNDGVPAEQETADQPAEAAPSQLTAEQISQLVTSALDQRIGGLQSSMDKNIASVRKEFQRSQMSESELEDAREQELIAERDAALRERDALRAAQQYPEVFPTYEAMLNAQTPEDQLQALDKALKSAAGSQPTPEAPAQPSEEVTPSIDPNAPAPTEVGGIAANAGQMTGEKANRILDALQGTWNEALGRNT